MRLGLVLATIGLTQPGSLQAQEPKDSVEIHRAAQAAQVRFERRRRDYLPIRDGAPPDACDEVIGRFCFTYGDRDSIEVPPADSAPVTRARDQLVTELANASRALPGDHWIAGQRVRYLAEDRRGAEAATAALACRPAADWWCLALLGYAYHAGGAYAAAESAYDRALAAMPRDERCRWTDLTMLLDEPVEGYQRATCGAQDSMARRFWWLADPLVIVPGNDRLTEHYSRWVMNRLQADAVSPWGYGWTPDLRQILIRFGWPAGWARSRQSGVDDGWAVSASFQEPERAYEPRARFVTHPETIAPGTWTLIPDRPTGGFVPEYVLRLDTLPSQVALFRRDEAFVVVAGYDLSQDSVAPDVAIHAGLSLSGGPDGPVRVAPERAKARARGVLTLETPPVPGLLSLEALAPDARRAGRQRYWLPLAPLTAGRLAVSDLLLLTRGDSLPRTLETAIPLARPTTALSPQVAGLYWEVYGLGPGTTPFSVGLTVVRESVGFFRRAARALGLGGERPQVRLAWDDVYRPGTATSGASLALDLSGANPGRYTIRLAITAAGDSAVTQRQITITDGGTP
ncbi:MAG: hypothetical protein EXR93_11830 [Gemmatimonadetes bacterium]|nr:hypothetical protein [Gemmatimonadota bacterium]